MSSKNNVNPDHYKIAGRDRPADDVDRSRIRSNVSRKAEMKRIPKPGPKFARKAGVKQPEPVEENQLPKEEK